MEAISTTIMTNATKTCSKCGENKSKTEFHTKRASKDGCTPQCKVCRSENYHVRRDDCLERQRNCDLTRKYGISSQEYNDLFQIQNGCCNICFKTLEEINERYFCVDHCHNSGVIRGLLCRKCNSGIGMFDDNPKILKSALEYITRHTV